MSTDNNIMHEADWKKDGETGCLMSLVKVGAASVALAAVLAVGYLFGNEILAHLWAR